MYDNEQLRKDIATILEHHEAPKWRNRTYMNLGKLRLVQYQDDGTTIVYHGKTAISHNRIDTTSYVGRTIINEAIRIEELGRQ